METNFLTGLAFVWRTGFDTPDDGYHVTRGDAGGGTFGGVTEATWAAAMAADVAPKVHLSQASRSQLSDVLRWACWGNGCQLLPAGLDLMLFNGCMMSGAYPKLLQEALGMIAAEVDGKIGPHTAALAGLRDVPTLIHALHGSHHAYLMRLDGWQQFGLGWQMRLIAVRTAALTLARSTSPPAATVTHNV